MLGIAEDESECAAYLLCVLYYCTGAMQRPRTSTCSAALSCLGESTRVGTDEVSIEKNNALWLIRTPLLYWTLPGNGSPRMDESSSRIICRLTVVGPKIESPTSALTPLHQASINTVAHTASKINITPHQSMCVQHSTREQITALSCTGLVLLWWLKQEDLSYASLPRLVHAGFRIETNHAQCCGLCSDVG